MSASDRAEGREAGSSSWPVLAILTAIVAGIYGQTYFFGYVYDDQWYLLSRPVVREGLSAEAVLWALQTWEFGNWFPLTRLSWLADVELFGMKAGPAHLVNALLHLATAWCMFLFLAAATGRRRCSVALAAIWVAHPINVEVVAWISERSLLLATLSLWATLCAYLAYVRRPGAGLYLLMMAGALLGYLAKPILLALPLLLLVLDWWPLGRVRAGAPWPRLLIFEKLPIAVLAAAFGFKAAAAQSSTGALASLDALSLADRAGSALRGGAWYLGKFVLPTGLGVLYPLSTESAPFWRTAAAVSLLAFISVVAVWVRHRRPQVLAGWLWFVLTLLPVSGLVQTGSHSVAARFAYIPLAGLLMLVSAIRMGRGSGAWEAGLTGIAAAVLVTAFSAVSCVQTRSWRNEMTLFSRALAVGGGESPIVRNHLAEASERAGDYSGAVRHHQVALRLRPDWAMTYRGLGRVLARQGDLDAAERHLRQAVQVDPGDVEAREDLDDLLRCRAEPALAAACLERTIVARADDKWR